MSKEIIKWKQLYKVIFKDNENPKLITPQQYELIKKDLFLNKWVEIDNELFNPFQILKITKYKTQDGIVSRLNKENEEIQKKVRWFMRNYKNELTIWVLENMINKAKE